LDQSKRIARSFLLLIAGGILSCILLAVAAYISNSNLQTGPAATDKIDSLDKSRLAETLHLKTELGELVWPGWGDMDIPILLWHQENSFLIGILGSPVNWEEVPGDTFQGKTYFQNQDIDPENFAMLIGNEWVASMATKNETDLFLRQVFQEILPSPFDQFIPYRLLIQPSEVQISAVLHESFHVYQALESKESFYAAEAIYLDGDRYWSHNTEMGDQWKNEISCLIDAVNATTDSEAVTFTQQFLENRDQRRAEFGFDPVFTNYERRFEWLEGLAKYVELAIWEQASHSMDYKPISEMADDPDFKRYTTFDRYWNREIQQAKTQVNREGDVRFYYTGMFQARILDRLMPDWKTRIMETDVFIEDLLREAITQ